MLSISYIRDNKQLVQEAAKNKGAAVDIEALLTLDEQRRDIITRAEELREQRNEHADSLKKGKPTPEQIETGKRLKSDIAELESKLETVENEYFQLLKAVPNIPSEDTPVGDSEDQNKILKTVGDKPEFGFTPKPHWEMPQFVEQERAAKISGARFAFIKGGMAGHAAGAGELGNAAAVRRVGA